MKYNVSGEGFHVGRFLPYFQHLHAVPSLPGLSNVSKVTVVYLYIDLRCLV